MPLNLQAAGHAAGQAGYVTPTGPTLPGSVAPPPSIPPAVAASSTGLMLPTNLTNLPPYGVNPNSASSVPTWAWILGGVGVIGILGVIFYAVSQSSGGASSASSDKTSEPNPLPRRRRRTRRRGRK
jgi:hypothetical protein